MKTCTFFGHRDTPESIGDALLQAIEELITRENVLRFYVGNQGRFDALVLSALRQLKKVYPQIEYAVVLAYLPKRELFAIPEETLFPEEVATALPRFAIDARNRFLVEHCDYAMVYVNVSYGGAFKFASLAKRKGKTVRNLAENAILEK